jgi:hypothetical protein
LDPGHRHAEDSVRRDDAEAWTHFVAHRGIGMRFERGEDGSGVGGHRGAG